MLKVFAKAAAFVQFMVIFSSPALANSHDIGWAFNMSPNTAITYLAFMDADDKDFAVVYEFSDGAFPECYEDGWGGSTYTCTKSASLQYPVSSSVGFANVTDDQGDWLKENCPLTFLDGGDPYIDVCVEYFYQLT